MKPSGQRQAVRYCSHASSVAKSLWNCRRVLGNGGLAPFHTTHCGLLSQPDKQKSANVHLAAMRSCSERAANPASRSPDFSSFALANTSLRPENANRSAITDTSQSHRGNQYCCRANMMHLGPPVQLAIGSQHFLQLVREPFLETVSSRRPPDLHVGVDRYPCLRFSVEGFDVKVESALLAHEADARL